MEESEQEKEVVKPTSISYTWKEPSPSTIKRHNTNVAVRGKVKSTST